MPSFSDIPAKLERTIRLEYENTAIAAVVVHLWNYRDSKSLEDSKGLLRQWQESNDHYGTVADSENHIIVLFASLRDASKYISAKEAAENDRLGLIKFNLDGRLEQFEKTIILKDVPNAITENDIRNTIGNKRVQQVRFIAKGKHALVTITTKEDIPNLTKRFLVFGKASIKPEVFSIDTNKPETFTAKLTKIHRLARSHDITDALVAFQPTNAFINSNAHTAIVHFLKQENRDHAMEMQLTFAGQKAEWSKLNYEQTYKQHKRSYAETVKQSDKRRHEESDTDLFIEPEELNQHNAEMQQE
jgi:hypothetical protein